MPYVAPRPLAIAGVLLLAIGWITAPSWKPAQTELRVTAPIAAPAEKTARIPAAASPPQPSSDRPIVARAPARRIDDRSSLSVSTPELIDEILRLEVRHRAGDADAGYPLFAHLEQCARAPAIAEELRRNQRQAQGGAGMPMPDSLVDEAAFIEGECRRLAPGLLARRFEILEVAASRGDLRARLDYASNPPEFFSSTEGLVRNAEQVVEFKAKAVAWLLSTVDRGSPMAMLKLAGIYREGLLAERNDVAALAYYLAWDEVGGSEGGVDPYRQQREWGMSAAQLQQAREMQRQIVARCCR